METFIKEATDVDNRDVSEQEQNNEQQDNQPYQQNNEPNRYPLTTKHSAKVN